MQSDVSLIDHYVDNRFNPEFQETLEALLHESPFFLFTKTRIIENFRKFETLFPGSSIHYAMKANSEPEILQTLSDAGCSFEVASIYELNMLKELKVPAERIIFGTSIKPASHIKQFFDYGVNRFAFDSHSELEKIASAAPGARVYVRAIAYDAGSVYKFSEKFGADLFNVVSLLLRAKELGLRPYGISFNVGSQASNPRAWASTLKDLAPIIKELQDAGVIIDVLNLGGGFPCAYTSATHVPLLEVIADHTLEEYKKLPYQPKLILEPGRGLIADTGTLVTSVIARVERKGATWLFLDAGCYNALFETMAYQGSTRYAITSMRQVGEAGESLFAVAGPTGDSHDVITREVLLPQDIAVGDRLIVRNVGAYSLVNASSFNGFPKPDVYFV